jgi:four helix bundle protein
MRKVVLNSPGEQTNGKGVTPMKSVEELDVFRLAHELALKVYKVTIEFPKDESFNLVIQMRRAASSVGMNLVEESMRLNRREFRHFVGIARGSAAEVSYQLLLARDLGYLQNDTYLDLRSSYERIGQMLTRLAQSLGRS